MALPARVDRAALRLEDAGPGRGRKHLEARRGVEPRSTILQTVSLPEQRAVGADRETRTLAVQLGRLTPDLRVTRNGRTRSPPSSKTDNGEQRRPGASGGNRTRATPIPTACSTFELQRQHLVESPGTAPGEPACKAGARPSARPRRAGEESNLVRRIWNPFGHHGLRPVAPRTRIELVSLDRQSSCDTSPITRHSVLLARIERAGGV